MKKLLLSLFCLIGVIATQATEVTVTFSELGYSNAQEITTVSVDDNITLTFDKGDGSTTPKYYTSGTAIRAYAKNTITVATTNQAVTINSVAFSTVSDNYAFKDGMTASAGTADYTNQTITNINASETVITNGTSDQLRINAMTITYTMGEVTQVSTPTITPNGGEVSATDKIALECATDGASIYYTLDGTEPSATNGTLYSEPFTLTAAATVKAIAVDPTGALNASTVTEASFTFPVANIAEFISKAQPYATSISGNVTVVAQSGSYLFLQDETSRIIAFGSLNNTYNNGDQLANIKGTYTLYNGIPEMNVVASSFGTATAGTAVEPETLTIEEIAIDNLLAYIKIEGVTIPESSSKSYTITDATGSMTMYNTLNITIPSGENLTVTGFISCYGTTVQIMPLEITSASGLDVIEAPIITPNGGEITTDQQISISCLTDGASIYYTLDGTEPSATNGTLYSEPFTLSANATVKAIAVKEGAENSSITEATFTLLSASIKTGSFNFTDPSTLNPVQQTPEAGGNVVVNDTKFTSGSISLVCAKGESASTDCRLYLSTSAGALVDLRTYKSSTITISGDNANILSISFTGNKASATQLTADKGTFNGKTWTPTEDTSSVVFTTTATTNIQTITVLYENTTNGIEEIATEENVPVEYYNLQGVKISEPQTGLYIRIQGNKATKVFVK